MKKDEIDWYVQNSLTQGQLRLLDQPTVNQFHRCLRIELLKRKNDNPETKKKTR